MIDSFPLPACKFGRARYCRSFRENGAEYGKCLSKKEPYFGFKVHALITLESYITAFEITPASVDDREDLRDFAENRLGLAVLGDKGHTGERLFEDMRAKRYMPYVIKTFQLQNKLVKEVQTDDLPVEGGDSIFPAQRTNECGKSARQKFPGIMYPVTD